MRHCYFALGESFFTLVVFGFPVCWPYLGRVSGPGMLIDWLTMHSSRISIREGQTDEHLATSWLGWMLTSSCRLVRDDWTAWYWEIHKTVPNSERS